MVIDFIWIVIDFILIKCDVVRISISLKCSIFTIVDFLLRDFADYKQLFSRYYFPKESNFNH